MSGFAAEEFRPLRPLPMLSPRYVRNQPSATRKPGTQNTPAFVQPKPHDRLSLRNQACTKSGFGGIARPCARLEPELRLIRDHPVEIGGISPAIWPSTLLRTIIEGVFTAILAVLGKFISPWQISGNFYRCLAATAYWSQNNGYFYLYIGFGLRHTKRDCWEELRAALAVQSIFSGASSEVWNQERIQQHLSFLKIRRQNARRLIRAGRFFIPHRYRLPIP